MGEKKNTKVEIKVRNNSGFNFLNDANVFGKTNKDLSKIICYNCSKKQHYFKKQF